MKILLTLGSIGLLVAGRDTYPDHQYSSTPTYSTTPSYTSRQVISSPGYGTTVTTPSPSYTVTQGSAASSQLMTDADRALIATIRNALNQNPAVSTAVRNLYLDSRNGTVTLTGTVPTEQDRQFIDNVVRNTAGVYEVNDQTQVTIQPTGANDSRVYSTPPDVNLASPGTIFNLHVQGLDEPDRSTAQRILQELRTDTILPSLLPMVNITVSGGRVILEGNVQNERQRRAIETAVQRAVGGRNVTDRLQVR